MGFLAQNAVAAAEKQDQGRPRSVVFSSFGSRGAILRRVKPPPASSSTAAAEQVEEETMDEENLLYEILKETDLLKFQDDLALKLQITKIEHFDHVKDSDLKVTENL